MLRDPIQDVLKMLGDILNKLQKAIYFLFLQVHPCIWHDLILINTCEFLWEEHKLILEKIPIRIKGYCHRHDIVFSQALTTVVASFILQLQSCILDNAFLIQLQDIGFLLHWESLLSTHGDEIGMLEDFVVVMQNLNMVSIKIVPSNESTLRIEGKRYSYILMLTFTKMVWIENVFYIQVLL